MSSHWLAKYYCSRSASLSIRDTTTYCFNIKNTPNAYFLLAYTREFAGEGEVSVVVFFLLPLSPLLLLIPETDASLPWICEVSSWVMLNFRDAEQRHSCTNEKSRQKQVRSAREPQNNSSNN